MSKPTQSLSTIERPRCSRCQSRMMLERISPGPVGLEHRLFECPTCNNVEAKIFVSDPLNSQALGWMAGELKSPG